MAAERKASSVWGALNTVVGGMLLILGLAGIVGALCADPRGSAEPPLAAGIAGVILVLLLLLLPWCSMLLGGGVGLLLSHAWGRTLSLAWAWLTLCVSTVVLFFAEFAEAVCLVCGPLILYSVALLSSLSARKRDTQGDANPKQDAPAVPTQRHRP